MRRISCLCLLACALFAGGCNFQPAAVTTDLLTFDAISSAAGEVGKGIVAYDAATSASLGGEALPLPAGVVEAHSFFYDMAYAPEDTAFVRWAQQRGCTRAVMGLGLLVEQAAESFFIWRGIRPDTAAVLAALKVELSIEG